MENNKSTNRIHPLLAGAAISVIVVSLAGVAALTGLLPNSHGTAAPAATGAAETAAPTANSLAAAGTTAAPAPSKPETAAAEPKAAPAKPPVHAARTAKAAPAQSRPAYAGAEPVAQAPAICASCGRVESVQAIQHEAKPSGVGVVAGAVLGGVLGNQVGGGNGRTLATVAGAVGGGYAGNQVEKHARATTSYQVKVRMEDGSVRSFPYAQQPGWNVGDRVRVVDGQLTSRA